MQCIHILTTPVGGCIARRLAWSRQFSRNKAVGHNDADGIGLTCSLHEVPFSRDIYLSRRSGVKTAREKLRGGALRASDWCETIATLTFGEPERMTTPSGRAGGGCCSWLCGCDTQLTRVGVEAGHRAVGEEGSSRGLFLGSHWGSRLWWSNLSRTLAVCWTRYSRVCGAFGDQECGCPPRDAAMAAEASGLCADAGGIQGLLGYGTGGEGIVRSPIGVGELTGSICPPVRASMFGENKLTMPCAVIAVRELLQSRRSRC
jgi:hypothetical protein